MPPPGVKFSDEKPTRPRERRRMATALGGSADRLEAYRTRSMTLQVLLDQGLRWSDRKERLIVDGRICEMAPVDVKKTGLHHSDNVSQVQS